MFNPPGLHGKRSETSTCTHTQSLLYAAALGACHSILNPCGSCARPVLLGQHFLDGETEDWDDKAVKDTELETDTQLNWTQQFDHLSIFLTTRRPHALVHCSLSRCVFFKAPVLTILGWVNKCVCPATLFMISYILVICFFLPSFTEV